MIHERTKGKVNLELVGFLVILASMGGCSVGLVMTDMGITPGFIGIAGFSIGFVIFIAGRFQAKD